MLNVAHRYLLFARACRWLTLTKSNLLLNADEIFNSTGYIYFESSEGGWTGSMRAHASDVLQRNSQFESSSSLSWDITNPGTAASLLLASNVSLFKKAVWDANGDVSYGFHKYHLHAAEAVSSFLVNADGEYGGKLQNW